MNNKSYRIFWFEIFYIFLNIVYFETLKFYVQLNFFLLRLTSRIEEHSYTGIQSELKGLCELQHFGRNQKVTACISRSAIVSKLIFLQCFLYFNNCFCTNLLITQKENSVAQLLMLKKH